MPLSVNPRLISLARESLGMTQAELADAMHISQSKLSKYENGALQMSDEDLPQLSEATGYTEEFFQQDVDVRGFGSMCFYHRKRAAMSVNQLRKIQAQLNIFRMQLQRIRKGIEIETTNQFHELDVDEFGGPGAVAREARRLWGLPMGPVKNLIGALERSGGFVKCIEFGTRRLDAVSHLVPNQPPIFFINRAAPNDRVRYTLAHELGHVLMHTGMPSADMEREADEFAAEFLMPSAEIGSNLSGLTIERLPALKAHWRVSMATLIKRAADLGKISERHYATLFAQMSKSGWRLREPIEIASESPTVVDEIVRIHISEHRYDLKKLSQDTFYRRTDDFVRFFIRESGQAALRIIG